MFDLNLEVGANCSTIILKIAFLDKKLGPLATALLPVCIHVQTYASRSTYIGDCRGISL